MSRINLLQSGMQGVDLKSNPLLIGEKKKLRFATNMVFEEGVLRSRPGFRYSSLCCSGQFQGAVDFQPTRGLSYQPHSSADAGIAIVVKGSLYLNGEKLTGNVFKSKGPVNLFQAENYLIIQNTETSTYWWDGETFTESPGMNEVDFAEIETPVYEREVVVPVADIPDCAIGTTCANGGIIVDVQVIDHTTEEPISGATFTLNHNENLVYENVTDSSGHVTFEAVERVYDYTVTRPGYTSVVDEQVSVEGCTSVTVRLQASEGVCDVELTSVNYLVGTPESGSFVINNVGTELLYVTSVSGGSVIPSVPFTVAPGDFANVTVVAEATLEGETLSVVTSCGNYTEDWTEAVVIEGCELTFDQSQGPEGMLLIITNSGDSATLINTLELSTNDNIATGPNYSSTLGGFPILPYEISPGEGVYVGWTLIDIDNRIPYGYVLNTTCNSEDINYTGTILE